MPVKITLEFDDEEFGLFTDVNPKGVVGDTTFKQLSWPSRVRFVLEGMHEMNDMLEYVTVTDIEMDGEHAPKEELDEPFGQPSG